MQLICIALLSLPKCSKMCKILTFLYFAYGSNLLAERIHINSPTAVRKDIGRLENFTLDFTGHADNWHGAPATIVPTPAAHVWGAVWEIDSRNLENLDRQEGVGERIYFPLEVNVTNPRGEVLRCRVYQHCNNPNGSVPLSQLPEERRPSLVYLTTMVRGAEESQLPQDYVNFLKSVKHNGYTGEVDIGIQQQ